MTVSAEQAIDKMYKAFGKVRNNLKRADLDFTVQISKSSTDPKTTIYAAQMTAMAEGLAPYRIITSDYNEILEILKLAAKKIDAKEVELAYHKEQIAAGKRTIEGHEARIEEIESGEDDAFFEEQNEYNDGKVAQATDVTTKSEKTEE